MRALPALLLLMTLGLAGCVTTHRPTVPLTAEGERGRIVLDEVAITMGRLAFEVHFTQLEPGTELLRAGIAAHSAEPCTFSVSADDLDAVDGSPVTFGEALQVGQRLRLLFESRGQREFADGHRRLDLRLRRPDGTQACASLPIAPPHAQLVQAEHWLLSMGMDAAYLPQAADGAAGWILFPLRVGYRLGEAALEAEFTAGQVTCEERTCPTDTTEAGRTVRGSGLALGGGLAATLFPLRLGAFSVPLQASYRLLAVEQPTFEGPESRALHALSVATGLHYRLPVPYTAGLDEWPLRGPSVSLTFPVTWVVPDSGDGRLAVGVLFLARWAMF